MLEFLGVRCRKIMVRLNWGQLSYGGTILSRGGVGLGELTHRVHGQEVRENALLGVLLAGVALRNRVA